MPHPPPARSYKVSLPPPGIGVDISSITRSSYYGLPDPYLFRCSPCDTAILFSYPLIFCCLFFKGETRDALPEQPLPDAPRRGQEEVTGGEADMREASRGEANVSRTTRASAGVCEHSLRNVQNEMPQGFGILLPCSELESSFGWPM